LYGEHSFVYGTPDLLTAGWGNGYFDCAQYKRAHSHTGSASHQDTPADQYRHTAARPHDDTDGYGRYHHPYQYGDNYQHGHVNCHSHDYAAHSHGHTRTAYQHGNGRTAANRYLHPHPAYQYLDANARTTDGYPNGNGHPLT
jgi:hypothetical protein